MSNYFQFKYRLIMGLKISKLLKLKLIITFDIIVANIFQAHIGNQHSLFVNILENPENRSGQNITTLPPNHHNTRGARVPLDASRRIQKGETNGLCTLYVQKAYQVDDRGTFSVLGWGGGEFLIIHNNNHNQIPKNLLF